LFIFGVLKSVTFGDFIKKFINLDRIRENRVRNEKFMELVAKTHNVHDSFKVYSRNPWLTFTTSFFLLAMSSGTSFALHVPICVLLYNL